MSAQELCSYTGIVWPLLGGIFCLPTMDEVAAGRALVERPLLLQPKEFGQYVPRLILTGLHGLEKEPWRILTHAFVHQDFDHLRNNAMGILEHGFWVYTDGGVGRLYAAFLCGVAACGANDRGRERQTQAMLEGSLPRVPESIGPLQVPEGARDSWQWLRGKTAMHVAPLVHRSSSASGASGGVAALLGYSFVTALLKLGRHYR